MSHIQFSEGEELDKRRRLWKAIVEESLQPMISLRPAERLLDVDSGWGEFINAVECPQKFAIDFDASFGRFVADGVAFSVQDMRFLAFPDAFFDVVFASNVLEHLRTKDDVLRALVEFHRVLKPGGQAIILQPNFKYCSRNYYDFFDHYCAYTERSMVEGLRLAKFASFDRVVDRFLPFTTKSRLPQWLWLVRLYLRLPIVWRIFGGQFLIVARRSPR
ncbi:MAG TPA: class I SAM-dependent methyltransferase [Thermoanaerobaculia bacterium]|nr:class I SAM-dependent methyltransferase [Thermoanaerobaculia bacterium]